MWQHHGCWAELAVPHSIPVPAQCLHQGSPGCPLQHGAVPCHGGTRGAGLGQDTLLPVRGLQRDLAAGGEAVLSWESAGDGVMQKHTASRPGARGGNCGVKTGGNHSPHGQCPCWAGQPGPAAPRRHAGVRGASTSPASQLKIENLKTSNFHSAKNSRRRLGAGSRGTPAPGQPRGPARDAGTRVVRGRWPRSGRRVAPAPGTAPGIHTSPRGCCGMGPGTGTVWTEGAAPIATACFPSCGRPFAFSQLTSTLRLKIPGVGHVRGAQPGRDAAGGASQPTAGRPSRLPHPSHVPFHSKFVRGLLYPPQHDPYFCSAGGLLRHRRCRENNFPGSTDYSCPRAVPVGIEPHPVLSCCFSDLSRLFLNYYPAL